MNFTDSGSQMNSRWVGYVFCSEESHTSTSLNRKNSDQKIIQMINELHDEVKTIEKANAKHKKIKKVEIASWSRADIKKLKEFLGVYGTDF